MSRVYALYGRNKHIALLLASYLSVELAVALWIYSTPGSHRAHELVPSHSQHLSIKFLLASELNLPTEIHGIESLQSKRYCISFSYQKLISRFADLVCIDQTADTL